MSIRWIKPVWSGWSKWMWVAWWIAVVFWLVVMATSCGQKAAVPVPVTERVSSLQIKIMLSKHGLKCESGTLAGDLWCRVPSEEWFRLEFPAAYRRFLGAIRDAGIGWPDNDCDDHARAAALCGNLIANGMAIGEYWYWTRDGKQHAVNIAVVNDRAGMPKVLFWEPQKLQVVVLTTNEVQNGCIMWRM